MKKILKLVQLLFQFLIHKIASIIPKKKHLWVYGAWFGKQFSDNPKFFFEYVCNSHPEIKAVWITHDDQVVNQVRSIGYKAFRATSIIGIWHQLRASKVIICQSAHDDLFAPAIGQSTQVVNLWHGIPMKKIMYDAFSELEKDKNIWGKLEHLLTPYNKHRNDLLIATSPETQALLANAFRIPTDRVKITGFPRNDVFQTSSDKEHSEDKPFECLYLPTFRGGIGSECDLFYQYGFNAEKIDKRLKEQDIFLVLRMHPVNKPTPELLRNIENATNIRLDATTDLYNSIAKYDVLITDYSSGYVDFLVSGKPVLFAPFDLDTYLQSERSLYHNYKSVTLAPYSYNWDELIENIIKTKDGMLDDNYNPEYIALRNRFHSSLQNKALFSKRVFKAIS